MPVVDASVLVTYLVGGEAADVRERLLSVREWWWAPHLVDAEVGHVLRRATANGELTVPRAAAALADLGGLPLRRAAHVGLLERAWALRHNLSFYDALYVALAERLEMPLLTLDRHLAGAPRLRVDVEILG